MKFTEEQQKLVLDRMKEDGFTVRRWSEEHGFIPSTVKNVLYRDQGLRHQRCAIGRAIMADLHADFLDGR